MSDFGAYRPTGREMRDPVARLVELETEDGLHHTAIVYDEAYRGHAALTLNIELVSSFLEYPMVIGLVELDRRTPDGEHFVYPTGRVWTLADALRTYRDRRKPIGIRAGLEVGVLAAQILGEAGETGPQQGCFSHGCLNPWRLALKTDGQLQIFGYGLAQVDLLCHLADGSRPITAESLRYAPPERVEGQPEDAAADLHALAVIVYEVMLGRPLYDTHDIPKLKHMITMSEGTSMLTGGQTDLPPKLAKILARAMIYDPDTRVGADEFADELRAQLDTPVATGPSLDEVMKEVTAASRKSRPKAKKLREVKAATAIFTPGQLADMADDDDDDDDDAVEEKPTAEGRWGRVARSRKDEAADSEETKPATSRSRRRGPTARGAKADAQAKEEAPKPRSRRRTADAEEADAAPARRRRRTAEEEPEPTPAEEPRRRRRRRSDAAADAEAAPEIKATEAEAAEAKPRRRRRTASTEPEPTVAADSTPEPEAEPEPARRRRRTEPDAAAATTEPSAAPEEAPADAKPRRRRRSTPAAEPAAEAAPAEATPRRRRRSTPAAEPAAEAADEKPEPRRRRRRTPEPEAAAAEPAAEPRRRRRRTSAAAEPEAAPTAPAEDESAKPARRRRRSTKAEPAEPTPVESATEDEAPAPRRRRRRTTDEPAAAPRRRRRRSSDDDES